MTEPSPTQYVPPGEPEPQYAEPEPFDPEKSTSGLAIAALVTGVCGIVLCPLVLSIPAIIFGAIGMRDTDKDPKLEGRGMAIAGLVLGIVGTTLAIIGIIIVIAIGIAEQNDYDNREYYHPPPGRDYNLD